MKYSVKAVASAPEIIKRKLGGELIKPVTIPTASFTNGVLKAGTPITLTGAIANNSNAKGILLNDVYEEDPVGAIVMAYACLNQANIEANAGITLDTAVKTALAHIRFE